MEAFRSFIEKYTFLSDSDWARISSAFEKKEFSKDDLILKEGKICSHLYFLENGLLRYFIIKEGEEITKYFTESPYCFTSQVSFTSEKPSKENIQAIEDSLIWQTTLIKANELLALQSWSTFIRKLIQEVQYYTEEILQELQTETAESRYEKLLLDNPSFLQRIPLKYIASYLGIAPQSLSRIRKKIADNERN